jgi:hypothetical protein
VSAHANEDWLLRFSPSEWIHAALAELEQAEAAAANGDMAGAVASCKRGAGMSLNALLRLEAAGELPPRIAWGRTYVEHLRALTADAEAPDAVRAAAAGVLAAKSGPAALVTLRLGAQRASVGRADGAGHPGGGRPLVVEQAHDVIAHVYALVVRRGAYVAARQVPTDARAARIQETLSSPSAEAALAGGTCTAMEGGRRNPAGSTS